MQVFHVSILTHEKQAERRLDRSRSHPASCFGPNPCSLCPALLVPAQDRSNDAAQQTAANSRRRH